MVHPRRIWACLVFVALVAGSCFAWAPSLHAQAIELAEPDELSQAAQLWEDFNYFIWIGRPDLASASAEALMERVTSGELLAIVEASDYKNWRQTITEASQIATVKDVAARLDDRIESAHIARNRDRDRIAKNIDLLGGTLRQRSNAIKRLRAAGQFAGHQLLAVLIDQTRSRLHPHVQSAMVSIGRPLVYPLSIALSQLEPVQMGQVAQVLAEIGYKRALPYLKQVQEDPQTDPDARVYVETAYDHLAGTVGANRDLFAAELFLTLAQNFYSKGTERNQIDGFDEATGEGVIWTYTPTRGLIPLHVPEQIFADVLAMRAADRAMALDPELDPALSLWLASNLRRENRLPRGAEDRATEIDLEPMFYARMAGPLRLHDVLDRALLDRDPALALDAIEALQSTAGTEALINREGAVQPLLRALAYPNRRVRFQAAFVMTQTRPRIKYPGSHRVVTVLAEAVRQSEFRHAMALAPDQPTLNNTVADLKDLGYEVTAGLSIETVAEAINARPGFDVIVIRGTTDEVRTVYRQALLNYKIAAAPILALVSGADQIELSDEFEDDWRAHVAVASSQDIRVAVQKAASASAGQPITRDQAAQYASTALKLLRAIAQSDSSVYHVGDAEPALIGALLDAREEIVIRAAQVLELINSQVGQLAIANAALDEARPNHVRIALLDSLAESAKQLGNKLPQIQLDNLLELVQAARNSLALAAARAHGALTLPTGNVVKMIAE